MITEMISGLRRYNLRREILKLYYVYLHCVRSRSWVTVGACKNIGYSENCIVHCYNRIEYGYVPELSMTAYFQ